MNKTSSDTSIVLTGVIIYVRVYWVVHPPPPNASCDSGWAFANDHGLEQLVTSWQNPGREKESDRETSLLHAAMFHFFLLPSFLSTPRCGESDMRFIYAASCVCHMLDDWSGMDKNRAVDYIKKSQVRQTVTVTAVKAPLSVFLCCRVMIMALHRDRFWKHTVKTTHISFALYCTIAKGMLD